MTADQYVPEVRTGTNGPVRTEPGTIRVHTRWLYSRSSECVCCPGRHAFARGGGVTASDWPARFPSDSDLAAHVHRAVSSFGDDVDLVITVAPANQPPSYEERLALIRELAGGLARAEWDAAHEEFRRRTIERYGPRADNLLAALAEVRR